MGDVRRRPPTQNYSRLPTNDVESSEDEQRLSRDAGFSKRQYKKDDEWNLQKNKIPWKEIAFAAFLFVVGTILLFAGCLIHTGHVDNEQFGDRLWPLIILGCLMFIPGSYHVYIAFNAFLGRAGYSFQDIPHYDD